MTFIQYISLQLYHYNNHSYNDRIQNSLALSSVIISFLIKDESLEFFYSNEFWSIISVWFWAVIMPGADMFFVIRSAVSSGKKSAYYASFGIIVGTVVWLIVGFFFIHLLAKTSFFEIVQIFGGSYLIYMAWQIFLSLKNENSPHKIENKINTITASKSFFYGVLTNLSNPKPPIFVSIILSKIPQTLSIHLSLTLLCLMTLIPLIWFIVVVNIFSIKRFLQIFMNFSKWIDGIVLSLFALFGISLIIEGATTLFYSSI